jgi:uncharacterized Zn finger protein
MFDGDWRPYVSVAERRQAGARHAAKLAKKGRKVSPVVIEGRTIAKSFWGKAWCDNLESYSDYANRLPRGRTYARNGSIVDLQIAAGRVTAIVSGSDIYEIGIDIVALDRKRWRALIQECGGRIGSAVELLRGTFSNQVMEILARPKTGLFPAPKDIRLSCSCPDWADMCKHVAAALYGVGARLDAEPELFFTLRQVDQTELISEAATARAIGSGAARGKKAIAADQLADVFGIELAEVAPARPAAVRRRPSQRSSPKPARRKSARARD